MHSLARLQRDMTAALLGGDTTALGHELTRPKRFAIYRNNSFISLTEALKATFPVTMKLADARFFAFAAHHFIKAHPPREARLSAYGGAFRASSRASSRPAASRSSRRWRGSNGPSPRR